MLSKRSCLHILPCLSCFLFTQVFALLPCSMIVATQEYSPLRSPLQTPAWSHCNPYPTFLCLLAPSFSSTKKPGVVLSLCFTTQLSYSLLHQNSCVNLIFLSAFSIFPLLLPVEACKGCMDTRKITNLCIMFQIVSCEVGFRKFISMVS